MSTVGRSVSRSAAEAPREITKRRRTAKSNGFAWGLVIIDSIAIDIMPAGVYFLLVMSSKSEQTAGSLFNVVDIARRSWLPSPFPRISAAMLILALMLALSSIPGCQGRDAVEQQKDRPLSPDERYLVELYMKITEIEENLQDNPEALEEKRAELREEIDLERIRRVLLELEQDPERWLAVYNRIFELQQRSGPKPSN